VPPPRGPCLCNRTYAASKRECRRGDNPGASQRVVLLLLDACSSLAKARTPPGPSVRGPALPRERGRAIDRGELARNTPARVTNPDRQPRASPKRGGAGTSFVANSVVPSSSGRRSKPYDQSGQKSSRHAAVPEAKCPLSRMRIRLALAGGTREAMCRSDSQPRQGRASCQAGGGGRLRRRRRR